MPLSTVSPVVITKYFTGLVAGWWKRTTVSFHVQSLRSFFCYASSRGWCATGIAESIDAPRVYTYESVRNGRAITEPWKFYDLGHGYCSYDFFEQCPHRMACAKCSFYLPKESTAAALLEGKSNLLRMRQEIALTDAEIAALDDGVSALESLLSRLENIPTPFGTTPRQLREESFVQIEGT